MSEDHKRLVIKWTVIVGWTGTVFLAALRFAGVIGSTSRAAQLGGLFIVIALWGAIARSRYIGTDTIVETLKVGMNIHKIHEDHTAKEIVIRLDSEGRVNSVENGELLGLSKSQISSLVASADGSSKSREISK